MQRRIEAKTGAAHAGEVPVRQVEFDFDASTMAKYCWGDNAFSSAYILTFSILIPHGERLVIEAVRQRRDEIRNPELRQRVEGLIGQEAWHSRVHKDFNAAYQAKGLPVDRIDALGRWIFHDVLTKSLPPDMLLAVTCAVEHFTAVVAEFELSEKIPLDALDRQAREFLLWHLVEECEHKSVAFDLYREVCDDDLKRRIAMLSGLSVGAFAFLYCIAQLRSTPGFSQGWRRDLEGVAYWMRPGTGRLVQLLPRVMRFMRKDFHPDQIDTDALLAHWRERLFGPDGELRPKLLKTVIPASRRGARTARAAS